jgi:DNA-directed RNA polymerase subunit RPC12/RpoP
MVRRASNRAPGPNDRWWAEHSLTCGGTFIKVKEPEKKTKQKKAEVKSTSKGKSKDIRDFMPAVKDSAGSSNVKGFKDLVNKVKGKYNSTSTIVVTKNTSSTSTSDSCYKPTIFNANASSRKTEIDRTSTSCSDDFLAVRNHWANRFSNTNKRPTDVEETGPKSKLARISESTSSDDYCECPVCNQRVLMADLNRHLDDCLKKDSETVEPEIVDLTEEMRDCPMCDAKIGSSSFDGHVEKCLLKMYDHWEEPEASEEEVSCLACGKKILKKDLNSHLDDCMSMSGIFEVEDGEGKTSECVESSDKDSTQFNCPFCMELVEESAMKDHIDACLKTDNNVVDALMDTAF